MEIFNNREIAIGFWIAVALVAVMASTKTRNAGYGILKAFAHRLILISLGLMASYIGLVVYGLHAAGLWDVGQLKNTLIWSVTVATVGLFRISSIIDDPHYFRHAIRDNFKLVAIFEFIIAFYTFPLLAEIIIVPVAIFLVAVHAYAEEKQGHAIVAKFFGNILAAAGVGLLIYAGYRIAADPDALISQRTLSDFLLPPVLTIFYLPFLYVLALYATYELAFTRLRFAIKNDSLRPYAKRAAISGFHFRTGLLKRWARNVMAMNPQSRTQIAESIREVKVLRKRERNPEDVPIERGWSPYAAIRFLEEEGFRTDDYHRILHGTDECYAASPPVRIGPGILPAAIAYYVEGDEFTAKSLKLQLDADQPEESQEAHDKLVAAARRLCENALGSSLPAEVEQALGAGQDTEVSLRGKKIEVSKETWPGHSFNGYTLKIIIRNDEEGESG